MTIGGRKIQTRSLPVSPTNTNDLTQAIVTPSHWLVDTFLVADWQKPQIFFPIWLMFVSGRQAVWTLWQSRFLTWWNSTTLCSFPFNSILTFPRNPSCVQIYLLSRGTLSPALKSWSHLNILKKAKNCRQGSSFSGPSTRHWVAGGLSLFSLMQASDWLLVSPFGPLIGPWCPPLAPGVHCLVSRRDELSLRSERGVGPNMQISWPRAWPAHVPPAAAGCWPLVYGNTDRGKTLGISIRSKSNTDGHWIAAPHSWTSSSGYLNDVNYEPSLRRHLRHLRHWESWKPSNLLYLLWANYELLLTSQNISE